MTFEDQLARAKAAPRETKTVTVCIDQSVARRRDELEAKIAAAEKGVTGRLSLPSGVEGLTAELAELEASAVESLVDLRFKQMDGLDWTDLTMRHPGREGVIADAMVGGYNIIEATREAVVRSGVRLEGDAEHAMSLSQWLDLFSVLSGYDISRITDAVYFLNDYTPGLAVEAAKKARASTSASEGTSN